MYFDQTTGFLWMTTEAGLVRYDGVNSRVFDLRDLPSLKSIRMFNFFPTLQGDVAGYNSAGEIFTIKNNSPLNTYGYTIHGFFSEPSYRKRNARSLNDLNIENTIYRKLHRHGTISGSLWLNDTTWLGIADNFLGFFEHEKLMYQWQVKNIGDISLMARNGFVYMVSINGSGYCLNLTDKKLVTINTADKVFTEGNPVMFYDNQNDQALLLNKNNLYEVRFKGADVSAKPIATLNDLPSDIVSIILHPNKRILFIATHTRGAYVYHLSPFTVYKFGSDNILNNNYASVLIDSSHIFTCRSLLFDLNTGKSQKIPVSIKHTMSMGLNIANNIWSATEGNIISFHLNDPGKIKRYPVTADNYLRTSFLTRNKKFWVSTAKFIGYEQNKEIKHYISFDSNPDSSSFYYLTETPGGQLTGISKKGIYFIDTLLKKFVPVLTDSQISEVRNINIDNADLWWITTYGKGIYLFDRKANKLTRFPVDDKGYLLYSHACIDDGYNNFLVPTNKGLFRLNRNNLLQIYKDSSTPLYYQYFDVSSGLLTNEFNGGCQPAFNRLKNGDIILPALQGLVRVKTSELPNPTGCPLFIDFIETKGNKYKPVKEIQFAEDERTQSWQLSFSQWDHPNSQGIFYRIDGDSLWQRLNAGESKIQLNDLTGGMHLLEIKYQFGLLPNQLTSLKCTFFIAKKYYETIWFWLAVFALLVVVISLAVRLRGLQLKRKNRQLQGIIKQNTQELFDKNTVLEETLRELNEALKGLKENSIFKNRLIGLLGHDMLVPLRFIANISDHLYNDAGKLNAEMTRETSGEIRNTAAELLYLGESLIQWIKLEEGTFKLILRTINIEEVVKEIVMVHKSIAAVKQNKIIRQTPSHLSCVYDPVIVKVILHNLLLNANKFTTAGSIVIQAGILDNYLVISVKDSGVGMRPDIVTSLNNLVSVDSQNGTDKETGWGMGYMLIIDLLRFAGGKLNVESAVGVGTKATFSLPLSPVAR